MTHYTNPVRVTRGKNKGAVGFTTGPVSNQNPHVTHIRVFFPDKDHHRAMVTKDRRFVEDLSAGEQLRLGI